MTSAPAVHTLQVGNTTIPYIVRYSDRALRKSVHVEPGRVVVVVPDFEDLDDARAFMHQKRRWVFDAVAEIEELAKEREVSVQSWESGAKIAFRGRRLMLRVEPAAVGAPALEFRSRFHVFVPHDTPRPARAALVQNAVEAWMRERALADARRLARTFASRLDVVPTDVRIGDQVHMWGTCGRDGVIRINWRLVQAPLVALEYVVAHEVCHLVERSHGEAFWQVLSRVYPRWREGKRALEEFEAAGVV